MKNITIRYGDDSFTLKLDAETMEGHTTKDILEKVFNAFNHGSGGEMGVFLVAKCRSLSVGDFVEVDGQWYQCAACGWSERSNEFMTDWFNWFNERLDLPKYQVIDPRLRGWCLMNDILHEISWKDRI